MDADHVRDLAAPVLAPRARAARTAALPKAADEGLAQFALGVGVDGVVDGLVRDVHAGLVGPKGAQCAGDLLRRPVPTQHVSHDRPQRAIWIHAARWPCGPTAGQVDTNCMRRDVARVAGIATQLPTHGAGMATQLLGDLAKAVALQLQRGRGHGSSAVNCWNLPVISTPYRGGEVLQFRVESALS
jgi:hypothetical protein